MWRKDSRKEAGNAIKLFNPDQWERFDETQAARISLMLTGGFSFC